VWPPMAEYTVDLGDPYELVSIGRADNPAGAIGPDWHCYVIRQGVNEIRGYRQGTLGAVTSAVEDIVVQLNDRRSTRGKRSHIVLRGRKRGQS